MTNKAIIRKYLPDLSSAALWEEQYDWASGGHFLFYRIAPANSLDSTKGYQLKVADTAPKLFWSDAVHAMEDLSGLFVEGCFLVGSGKVLYRDDKRLADGRLPHGFGGEAVFRSGDALHLLYLLQ